MNGSEIIDFIRSAAIIFPILYFGYFLIPCGLFYYYFYVFRYEKLKKRKIYPKRASSSDVWREIRYSTGTIIVFSIGTAWVRELIINGQTLVYLDWGVYPVWYHFLSFFLFMIAHDAYLYWIHRFMHIKGIFRRVHLAHHRSLFPTPFAVFASHPFEGVLAFMIIPVLLLIIPIHLWVLVGYFIYNLFTNIQGHLGFEIFPSGFFRLPFIKYSASPTSHQIHHIQFDKNYGGYFNIWDRLMGTYVERKPSTGRLLQ